MTDLAATVEGIGALAEPVRRALYDFVVASRGLVGREEAAEAVGVPVHTAKFHLDRLAEDGLLDVEFQRRTGRTGPVATSTTSTPSPMRSSKPLPVCPWKVRCERPPSGRHTGWSSPCPRTGIGCPRCSPGWATSLGRRRRGCAWSTARSTRWRRSTRHWCAESIAISSRECSTRWAGVTSRRGSPRRRGNAA